MSKIKTSFFCQSCGSQHTKWQGQCNACKQWNTLIEEIVEKADKKDWKTDTKTPRTSTPIKVNEILTTVESRMDTRDGELNQAHQTHKLINS